MPGPLRGPSDQRMAQQAVPEEPWYIQEARCDRSSGEGESHQEPRLLEKFLGMEPGKRRLPSQQGVGCGRTHEERHRREKTERRAHAQHKQMAEQRRMPRPRAWWRQGCHKETIICSEHEVLVGSQGHAQKAPGGRAWAERMRVCVTGKDKVSRNFKKTPESF